MYQLSYPNEALVTLRCKIYFSISSHLPELFLELREPPVVPWPRGHDLTRRRLCHLHLLHRRPLSEIWGNKCVTLFCPIPDCHIVYDIFYIHRLYFISKEYSFLPFHRVYQLHVLRVHGLQVKSVFGSTVFRVALRSNEGNGYEWYDIFDFAAAPTPQFDCLNRH